nr:MAG TPA: hypothetical protein [Bacteriophage sp.]
MSNFRCPLRTIYPFESSYIFITFRRYLSISGTLDV